VQARTRVLILALLFLAIYGPLVYLAGVLARGSLLQKAPYLRLAIIHAALAVCAGVAAYLAFRRGSASVRIAAGLALILNMGAVVGVSSAWTTNVSQAEQQLLSPAVESGRVGILVAPASHAPSALVSAEALEARIERMLVEQGLDAYVVLRRVPPISSEAQARRVGRVKSAHIVVWGEECGAATLVSHITVLGAAETDIAIEPLRLMLFMATQGTITTESNRVDGEQVLLGERMTGPLTLGMASLAVGRYKGAGERIYGLIAGGALPDATLALLHSYLGTVLLFMDRPDLALEEYARSNAILPNARAWTGIGNARLALRDWSAALRAYQEAHNLDPYDPAPYGGLGIVYARRYEVSRAIASHRQAIAVAPDEGAPYALLGLAYELTGNIDAAREAYILCANNTGPNAGLAIAALDRAQYIVRYPPTPVPTATPPPTPTPVPIPTSALYRVERGDTLQAIAIKFGVTVEEIVALNELKNASMIVIGQELMIPRKSTRR